MDPLSIIEKYYANNPEAKEFLIEHGNIVAKKAVELAHVVPQLNPDIEFIKEAAMLHDIGIFLCDAPKIGCHGEEPYLKHGIFGKEILEREGLPKHALVAERHIGAGLSKEEIIKRDLPLPHRDMLPVSIEEQIICFADKFHSKAGGKKNIGKIIKQMKRYGKDSVQRFKNWLKLFGYE